MEISPGGPFAQVAVEGAECFANFFSELRFLQPHAQFLLGDFMQDGHGVMVEILPASWRQFLEDFLRSFVPGPPKIPRDPVQPERQLTQCFAGQRFWRHTLFCRIGRDCGAQSDIIDPSSERKCEDSTRSGETPAAASNRPG